MAGSIATLPKVIDIEAIGLMEKVCEEYDRVAIGQCKTCAIQFCQTMTWIANSMDECVEKISANLKKLSWWNTIRDRAIGCRSSDMTGSWIGDSR